jgi:hypothetical protein
MVISRSTKTYKRNEMRFIVCVCVEDLPPRTTKRETCLIKAGARE